MTEREYATCLEGDCPFLNLSNAVLLESYGGIEGIEDLLDGEAAEAFAECNGAKRRIHNQYQLRVPCGLAGRMVEDQTRRESRG